MSFVIILHKQKSDGDELMKKENILEKLHNFSSSIDFLLKSLLNRVVFLGNSGNRKQSSPPDSYTYNEQIIVKERLLFVLVSKRPLPPVIIRTQILSVISMVFALNSLYIGNYLIKNYHPVCFCVILDDIVLIEVDCPL